MFQGYNDVLGSGEIGATLANFSDNGVNGVVLQNFVMG